MSYLTLPNSLTTGLSVRAADLNENFTTIQNNIVNGAYQLDVASMTASTVIAQTVVNEGDRSMDSATGQRSCFTMISQYGTNYTPSADGYLGSVGGSPRSYDNYQVVMPRSGSVIGGNVLVNVLSRVPANDPITEYSIHKNGAELVKLTNVAVNATATFGTNAVFARNAYQFSAGDKLGIYQEATLAGIAGADFAVNVEVVFDE